MGEIKSYYKEATSGEYYITTYNAQNVMNRVLVWCDFVKTAKKTFFPCKTCKRVQPYGKSQGDCAKYGLVMAKGPFSKKGATTNDYLCTTKAVHAEFKEHKKANRGKADGVDALSRAEAGKYIVMYHVTDV